MDKIKKESGWNSKKKVDEIKERKQTKQKRMNKKRE